MLYLPLLRYIMTCKPVTYIYSVTFILLTFHRNSSVLFISRCVNTLCLLTAQDFLDLVCWVHFNNGRWSVVKCGSLALQYLYPVCIRSVAIPAKDIFYLISGAYMLPNAFYQSLANCEVVVVVGAVFSQRLFVIWQAIWLVGFLFTLRITKGMHPLFTETIS